MVYKGESINVGVREKYFKRVEVKKEDRARALKFLSAQITVII
jgi:hypothetical protein